MTFLYMLGGLLCGVFLACQYVIFLAQRRSRWPWSLLLALGLLMFLGGMALALTMPQGNQFLGSVSGTLVFLSPVPWYVAAVVSHSQDKAAEPTKPDREPDDKGVWPPPPQPPA